MRRYFRSYRKVHSQPRSHTPADARAFRRELIDRAGGCCLLCRWRPSTPEEYDAIDMHHAVPAEKSFEVGAGDLTRRSTAAGLAEAAKCVPLCARCHRIHHALARVA